MKITAVIFLAAMLITPSAMAAELADISTVLPISAGTNSYERPMFLLLVDDMGSTYDYPINMEISTTEFRLEQLGEGVVTFNVRKDETLDKCLDRLLAIVDGAYSWEQIAGQTIVRPSAGTNVLDLTIDRVELNGATAWQAIKSLAVALNRHPEVMKPIAVVVPNTATLTSHLVPDSFTHEPNITLNAQRISARALLCEILRQSPEKIRYVFSHALQEDQHILQIHFRSGRIELKDEKVPPELEAWWIKEKQEIVEAFENR